MTGFTLPSGASIDEDNGDFVIKDSSGTVVLRRNESAGEWQLGGTDLTGIGSVSAEGATITQSFDVQNNTQPSATATSPEFIRNGLGDKTTTVASAGTTIIADNSAQPIMNISGGSGKASGLFVVAGYRKGSNEGFTDLLVVSKATQITVFASQARRGPPPRSYSFTNPELGVAIDGSGEEYTLAVQVLGAT